jgi:flagellar hook-associated protein 1 FlgK
MSLTVSLRTALSGLQLNQAAMTTTSNNVANANTEGYTRKQIEPSSRVVAGAGAGVELGELRRSVDERLVREIRGGASTLGTLEVKSSYLDRIQDMFGKPADDSALSHRIDALGTNFVNLSVTPESETDRIALINEAQRVAQQLRDMAAEIQDLRLEADQEVARAVTEVNTNLESVARLNQEIGTLKAQGAPTAELQDQRDRAIDTISEYMEINYFERSSGEVVVYTPDGMILADNYFKTLEHDAASTMSHTVTHGGGSIDDISIGADDLTPQFLSGTFDGRIAGLVQLRDSELPALQADLDRMTQVLRDQINAIHNRGTSMPAPGQMTGTRTFPDPATDAITLSSDVELRLLNADGTVHAAGTLTAGAYTPNTLQAALDTALGADGTASVVDGAIRLSSADYGIALADAGAQTVTLDEGNDGVDVETFANTSLSHFLGLNDFFVTQGNVPGDDITGIASLMAVRDAAGESLIDNPRLISAGAMDTAAAVGDPAVTPGNNAIATELAELFDAELEIPASGGNLAVTGTTLSGYAADILSHQAMETSAASRDRDFQTALAEQLDYRRSAVSGVNIDEEMANLVLFQNAYSASARVIDTARRMFETLEGIMR